MFRKSPAHDLLFTNCTLPAQGLNACSERACNACTYSAIALLLRLRFMRITQVRKLFHYGFARENYWLLARGWRAARLVRQTFVASSLDRPNVAAAIRAAEAIYLPPQPSWRLSDPLLAVRCANFLVSFPLTWGRCVERALILYHLLNGYGFPAQFRLGTQRSNAQNAGHAWVTLVSAPACALGEAEPPEARYQTIYVSPLPIGKASSL